MESGNGRVFFFEIDSQRAVFIMSDGGGNQVKERRRFGTELKKWAHSKVVFITPLFPWRPRNYYFVEATRVTMVIVLQVLNTTMMPYSKTATFKYESYNVL
jgi:hypothetical protein